QVLALIVARPSTEPRISCLAGIPRLLFLANALASCSTTPADEVAKAGELRFGAQTIPKDSFADSACLACLQDECQAALSDCEYEPGCGANLSCIKACPTDDRGLFDSACADACGSPED